MQVSTDRIMDSGDLERERGITITSKVTTVEHNGVLLNVVDSPGHSEYVKIHSLGLCSFLYFLSVPFLPVLTLPRDTK